MSGLYGVAVNGIFSGESMFSKIPNASKLALYVLCRQLSLSSFALIDCQIQTNHLLQLGAEIISRDAFLNILSSREDLCIKWETPTEFVT